MTDYRWNLTAAATGYDQVASVIHPHYREIQDRILARLPVAREEAFSLVDAGGGSGRLLERILEQYPQSDVINLDQSPAFLGLAERRLTRFGDRARCHLVRLQDNWDRFLDERPRYVVSMSAIHHLDRAEKQAFYRRCFVALESDGMLINGDEVRPESDRDYLDRLQRWAEHMQQVMSAGRVPTTMQPTLNGWIERNVDRFGESKTSGDDCHETVAAQLGSLQSSGFIEVEALWYQAMWAVFAGRKPAT